MDPLRPILVLEDDADAVELLKRAFVKAGLIRPVRVFPSGEEAIAYLSERRGPVPCLLLLDVKLPGKSGLEVLSWLKSRIHLRSLPVVMMTGSAASADIEEALRLGIRSYCVKPTEFEGLVRLARTLRRRLEGDVEEPAIR